MSNSLSRNGDIERLHPAIRERVRTIRDQLQKEKIPFEVFEAFRTPERQADLFAQGRSKAGNKVTWVTSWKSVHQYGLAVDFVLNIDGKWSWDTQGDRAAWWTRMHALAKENGMTPLFNSKGKLIELPHVQLAGVSTGELYKGNYPDGGDAIWAETLGDLIDNWSGSPPAPPRPKAAPQRPALPDADIAEMEAAAVADGLMPAAGAVPVSDAAEDARFQRLHAFVMKWEGGFSNHPMDKGGPTNMGITQKTLAAWRKKEVSVDDVKALTRAEADAIFRANYYAVCRCAEMPERTAMVVYNGAVLHGPGRSIELLQKAFNALGLTADGKPLEVDGIIGRNTITAARQTSSAALSEAYMDQQDTLFRSLDTFSTFGNGWLNRLAALREFVQDLPEGAGVTPSVAMKIEDSKIDLDLAKLLPLAQPDGRSGALLELARTLLAAKAGDDPQRQLLLRLLESRLPAADGKPPVTPVNAALGEGLGRMLDGKKSIIGIVGLLASVLVPELGLAGGLITFLDTHGEQLITLFSLITGWGFLGKIDKAIEKKTLL